MKTLTPEEFLQSEATLLDVRAPAEYSEGHMVGAHSFPLFTDAERAEVGTIYKHNGQQAAIKRGLELVGPKMRPLIESAEKYGSKEFRLHCWRGGMRSKSMAWLLGIYGFEVSLLAGGYKAYRDFLQNYFSTPFDLQVISGLTGSKKTLILHALRAQGEQVIDLEGAAGHQGSSFGNVLCESQPSTEHFHNLLFEEARHFDRSKPVWIEDESFMIGKCAMIRPLFDQKEAAPHHIIQIPLEERLAHLVSDYGDLRPELLVKATEGIRKRLGHQRADEANGLIEAGELKAAVEIILSYYDRMYQRSIDKKRSPKHVHTFTHGDVTEIARHLTHGNRP